MQVAIVGVKNAYDKLDRVDPGTEAKPKSLTNQFPELAYTMPVKLSFNRPVMLSVMLSETGKVEKVTIMEGDASPEFEQWVTQVMAGWEFEPAMMAGKPVAGELYITLQIQPL